MISLLDIEYLGDYRIAVSFSDGAEGVFDLRQYLESRNGPLLAPLANEDFASRAFVEAGALAWPNGLELAPLRVHEMSNIVKRAA